MQQCPQLYRVTHRLVRLRLQLLWVQYFSHMRWMAIISVLALLLPHQQTSAQTRTQSVTFADRSPLATTAESNKRFKWNEKIGDIDLTRESFQLYLPADYQDDNPFGVLVWISAGPQGGVPRREWLDLLDKHHLIWIGANNSGNERLVADRIRLAIEAAHNVGRKYCVE